MRYLVLLKDGTFDIVGCLADEIFAVARLRGAGICGAFDQLSDAKSFVVETAEELRLSIANTSKPFLVWSGRVPNSEPADYQSRRIA